MITNLRSGIVAGVLAVTTAVAGVGWYRSAHSETVAGSNPVPYNAASLNSSPVNPNGDPYASNVGYNNPAYNNGSNPNGYNNCDSNGNGYAQTHPADYAYNGSPYVSDRYVRSIRRPVRVSYARSQPYNTGYAERTRVVERYHQGRTIGKSALIIGGTAAGGAAIGALAGGGKGAALGALSGGLGGLVYDRLTHNR